MTRVSGYVLAGGESSRMQSESSYRDKALLDFLGETLLERALRTVSEVCGNASILCGTPERSARLGSYGRAVMDRLPGQGPLGGLDAALEDAGEEWLLIVPVDLPLLPAFALRELMGAATGEGGPGVACMESLDHLQPLPLVIHRAAHPVVWQALQHNERKLMPVLRAAANELCAAGLRILPAEALTSELDASAWFTNVNTPDDYRAARELAIAQNDFPAGASE